VSSLVHSSTLVTAGVFIVFRLGGRIDSVVMGALCTLGAYTLILSGVRSLFCTDFKKIVALSTLSQIRIMLVASRAGLRSLCFAHLISHAMFKSTLFIAVGASIHNASSRQDSRRIAGPRVPERVRVPMISM